MEDSCSDMILSSYGWSTGVGYSVGTPTDFRYLSREVSQRSGGALDFGAAHADIPTQEKVASSRLGQQEVP